MFTYVTYLALAVIGIVAFTFLGNIRFSKKQRKAILLSLFFTSVFFIVWDVLAVESGHWEFGLRNMLGILILNQPLEELAFFWIIPFFGIVLWELFGGKKNG